MERIRPHQEPGEERRGMKDMPVLSEADWALLLELLQRELASLPTEIHHTHKREYRDELRERRRRLESLLERIQAVPVG